MPSAIQLVRISIKAFTTNVNRPRVRMLIGRVKSSTSGRMRTFTNPKISATMISVSQSWRVGWPVAALRWIPGTTQAAASKATALMSSLTRMNIGSSGLGFAKDVQEHDGAHAREGVDEGRDQAQRRDEAAQHAQQVAEEADDQQNRHQDRAEESQRRRAPHRHAPEPMRRGRAGQPGR